jgi:hypothetical protein
MTDPTPEEESSKPPTFTASGALQSQPATLSGEGHFISRTITIEGEPAAVDEAVEHALSGMSIGSAEAFGTLTIRPEPAGMVLSTGGATITVGPAPTKGGRLPNRKIAMPWIDGSLYEMPNVQNHGTRNLGVIVGGGARVELAPNGDAHAVVNGKVAGMIELSDERGFAQLAQALSPRAVQTMVAVSRLIWEKTGHQPLNRAALLSVGEVARAMGYEPGADRAINPEIMRNVARDLVHLSKIQTWAADGPFDRKARTHATGWVAPLLVISAVHIKRDTETGEALPYEFDAMLGRNWAEAAAHYDMMQVPPGFMDLEEDQEILLGWFYLTAFRYRMTKARSGVTRSIVTICEESGISPGGSKHRGRFLDRLGRWHSRLVETQVIGSYERRPALDANLPPGEIFAKGEYAVTAPVVLLQAYAEPRRQADRRRAKP